MARDQLPQGTGDEGGKRRGASEWHDKWQARRRDAHGCAAWYRCTSTLVVTRGYVAGQPVVCGYLARVPWSAVAATAEVEPLRTHRRSRATPLAACSDYRVQGLRARLGHSGLWDHVM